MSDMPERREEPEMHELRGIRYPPSNRLGGGEDNGDRDTAVADRILDSGQRPGAERVAAGGRAVRVLRVRGVHDDPGRQARGSPVVRVRASLRTRPRSRPTLASGLTTDHPLQPGP